jgi:hypothetical protein
VVNFQNHLAGLIIINVKNSNKVIEAKKESSTRHKFGKIWSNLAIKIF